VDTSVHMLLDTAGKDREEIVIEDLASVLAESVDSCFRVRLYGKKVYTNFRLSSILPLRNSV